MKVHVFDTYVTIKDREGHPDMDDTLLEKLDEMLTTYGVPHAFTLPHEKTMEDCPEAVLCRNPEATGILSDGTGR